MTAGFCAWRRALWLVLAACALTACAKSPAQLRYEAFVSQNSAGQLRTPSPLPGRVVPTAVLHVRVFADDTFRSAVPLWRVAARRRLDTFFAYVSKRFPVRFEVDAVAEWHHAVPSSGPPQVDGAEFRALDRGDGVDWVIVLVGPTFGGGDVEEFGSADVATKLLFVRPGISGAERRSEEAVKNCIDGDLREMTHDRVRHRELMFLLRAWARSLGVPFDADHGYVLAPEYDLHASEFSAASVRILTLGLRYRTDWTQAARLAWGKEVLRSIADSPDAYGPGARAEVLAWSATAP